MSNDVEIICRVRHKLSSKMLINFCPFVIINLSAHICDVIFKGKDFVWSEESLGLPSSITPFIGIEFLGVLEILFHNFLAEKFALDI